MDRSVTRPTPHGLATRTLGGQIESVFQKPQQRLTGTAQLLNLVENQRNGLLNPAVRVFLQTITVLHIADRCGHDQLTALGLLVTGCQRALAQQIDFIFVELPFEPEQKPVVDLSRRVDGLLVHQNRIDHPAHLDQLLPVPAVQGSPILPVPTPMK